MSDPYLAALARARGGTLATLDAGLAHAHPDVVTLVPADPRAGGFCASDHVVLPTIALTQNRARTQQAWRSRSMASPKDKKR